MSFISNITASYKWLTHSKLIKVDLAKFDLLLVKSFLFTSPMVTLVSFFPKIFRFPLGYAFSKLCDKSMYIFKFYISATFRYFCNLWRKCFNSCWTWLQKAFEKSSAPILRWVTIWKSFAEAKVVLIVLSLLTFYLLNPPEGSGFCLQQQRGIRKTEQYLADLHKLGHRRWVINPDPTTTRKENTSANDKHWDEQTCLGLLQPHFSKDFHWTLGSICFGLRLYVQCFKDCVKDNSSVNWNLGE